MKVSLIHSLLLGALFSTGVIAADCVDCTAELKPFDGLVKNLEDIQAPSVVNCADELKEAAKKEYNDNFEKLPKKKAVVGGLKLEGSAEELKFLEKMLNKKPIDDWSKAKDCDTVLCALTRVYDSEESAHRSLNIAKRDNYIVSISKEFTMEKGPMGQLFSIQELRKIDLAYKMLPAGYRKLKTLDRIKRMPDGYASPTSPNAAAYASPGFHSSYFNRDGEITFMETGFSGEDSWGSFVAIHELTHHLDFSKSDKNQFGISESPEFLKLSGWKKEKVYETDEKTGKKKLVSEWKADPAKKFVREYAGTEPAEDFADSAAHYMYEPKRLKNLDPEKYDFFKNNVFGGREYLNEPDLGMSDEDIMKTCLEGHREFSLYGGQSYSNTRISSSCLDRYMKDFKYADPKTCHLNGTQIKNYLMDRITPQIEEGSESLKQCDQNLNTFRTECMNEGDFQKACSIAKCQLPSPLSLKAKDADFGDRGNVMIKAVEAKIGKTNFISTILINGLSDKAKVSEHHSLLYQKVFLENASKGLAETWDRENLKFDSRDEAKKNVERYIMMDKSTGETLSSFQTAVLKKATRSKEKNLELIKTWAASQAMKEGPQFDVLAETLQKYGSLLGKK